MTTVEEDAMDDPITWLRAQLDAREKWLRTLLDWPVSGCVFVAHEDEGGVHDHGTFDLAAELREVEAKRKMIEWVEHPATDPDDREPLLHLMALPYADRPGYREEWKP